MENTFWIYQNFPVCYNRICRWGLERTQSCAPPISNSSTHQLLVILAERKVFSIRSNIFQSDRSGHCTFPDFVLEPCSRREVKNEFRAKNRISQIYSYITCIVSHFYNNYMAYPQLQSITSERRRKLRFQDDWYGMWLFSTYRRVNSW